MKVAEYSYYEDESHRSADRVYHNDDDNMSFSHKKGSKTSQLMISMSFEGDQTIDRQSRYNSIKHDDEINNHASADNITHKKSQFSRNHALNRNQTGSASLENLLNPTPYRGLLSLGKEDLEDTDGIVDDDLERISVGNEGDEEHEVKGHTFKFSEDDLIDPHLLSPELKCPMIISKFSEQIDQISIQGRSGEKLEVEIWSMNSTPSRQSLPLEENHGIDITQSGFSLTLAPANGKPLLQSKESDSRVMITEQD